MWSAKLGRGRDTYGMVAGLKVGVVRLELNDTQPGGVVPTVLALGLSLKGSYGC